MKKTFTLILSFVHSLILSFAQSVSFTADVNSGCAPLTVNFTNTSVAGVSYEWDFGSGPPLDTNMNTTHIFLSAGEYVVTLFAYDSGGNFIDAYQEIISVFGSSGEFLASKDTACPNEFINFYSLDFASAYLWNFGDGSTASGSSVYHSFVAAGTYNVVLIINSSCGTDTIEQPIVIDSSAIPPVPEFNISPNPACPFEDIQFYFPGIASAINWDFGDSSFATSSSPVHAYNAAGNYPVTLTITNECGNSSFFADSVFVDASLIPDLPLFWFSPDSVCPGDEIHFNPLTSAVKYFWNFGDGDSTEGKFISHTYDSTGIFVVTLTVKNVCENFNSFSDTIVVDSSSVPPVPQFYVNANSVCPNDSIQFFYWGEATSFQWNFGDGTTSNQQSPIHSFASSGVYQVSLTITNNCGNSNTYTESIFVDSTSYPPTPSFYIMQNPACPGDEIEFHYWENASSYSWDFGDGNSSALAHTVHQYDSPGSYTVTLTITNGCGNSSSYSAQILISASGIPVEGTLTWLIPMDSIIAPCENVYFSSTGGNNYQWDFGDGASATTANPVHQYDTAGTYLVTVVITNGCGNSDTIKKEIDITGTCTFIAENSESQKISVYPNPNDGKFTVIASGVKQSEINIYNILGEIVLGKQRITINEQLSTNLSPGIYFLEIVSEKNNEKIKIVVR